MALLPFGMGHINNWALVSNQLLTAAGGTTDVDFLNLDLNRHLSYLLTWSARNRLGIAARPLLYYNADFVAANYYNVYILGPAAPPISVRTNNAVVGYLPPGQCDHMVGFIMKDPEDHPRFTSMYQRGDWNAITIMNRVHIWSGTANITRITIRSDQPLAFDAGSRFMLFRAI